MNLRVRALGDFLLLSFLVDRNVSRFNGFSFRFSTSRYRFELESKCYIKQTLELCCFMKSAHCVLLGTSGYILDSRFTNLKFSFSNFIFASNSFLTDL